MPKIDLPKPLGPRIDTSELVTTRVPPQEIKLAEPFRSIVEIRLEALKASDRQATDQELTRIRNVASARAASCLAFPWLHGCPVSAGRTATETAKNVRSAAARSVPECAASAKQPEAPARKSGRQLDRHQQARGPDRHERRAALG